MVAMPVVSSTGRIRPGEPLPDFSLPDASGRRYRLGDRGGSPVVVFFACNHCPFVIHVASAVGSLAARWGGRVAWFAVNPNDSTRYPADAPGHMGAFAARHGWDFPYLVDAGQEVARAYGAACTPEFFVGDQGGRLLYAGQFDASRPGRPGVPVDGRDLEAALEALFAGGAAPAPQIPSSGCSIKWLPGREPPWAPKRP
jgi:thiol-disulfide isomerase/thioredoxin